MSDKKTNPRWLNEIPKAKIVNDDTTHEITADEQHEIDKVIQEQEKIFGVKLKPYNPNKE